MLLGCVVDVGFGDVGVGMVCVEVIWGGYVVCSLVFGVCFVVDVCFVVVGVGVVVFCVLGCWLGGDGVVVVIVCGVVGCNGGWVVIVVVVVVGWCSCCGGCVGLLVVVVCLFW